MRTKPSPAGIRAFDTVLGHVFPKCPKNSEASLPKKKHTKLLFFIAKLPLQSLSTIKGLLQLQPTTLRASF
jgi:hypothetical protein